ncbi:CDP-alcohol phosphatidyltransferase family protein [Candidatus Odyssella thessalonicensis]|uniref:CDP-alcohol phosphatidyltransferase family protein n=1 Tax=Candidatus Odyssella thessalonicensis TaxID=84647 RepID=UPI000225B720|nr:phosphatidylcholine/phosphatidylserine synthase [Candidatus Odyssella thessalonicensis]
MNEPKKLRPKVKAIPLLSKRLPERFRATRERMSNVNIALIFPNLATILALCMGLSAVRFALQERWEFAVGAIFLAALFDGMDGRLARLLNATSRFGAELDSLSDFISFGVSPAIVIYLKSLHDWQGLGWLFCLYFSVCIALRLARFNTISIEGREPVGAENFFNGCNAPSAAILALIPTMLDIEFQSWNLWSSALINAVFLFGIGSLAISVIPMFSFKKVQIERKYFPFVLVGLTFVAGALFATPWITLSIVMFAYLMTIPFSIKAYKNIGQKQD